MAPDPAPYFTEHAIAERTVRIPGARNLREMGGYPTGDGRSVRRGMLFRSGHPGDIPATERERLHELGLRTIVDLRTGSERADKPFPPALVGSLDYRARDYEVSEGEIAHMLRDPDATAQSMADRMIAAYRSFPVEQRDGIAALFGAIVEAEKPLPLLVNCTAGKDRTGVACAILLSALGVCEPIVKEDYALTERLHDPSGPLFAVDPKGPFAWLATVDPEVWRAMMGSPSRYIDATFTAISEGYGNVEGYLDKVLGIGPRELDIVRDRCLTA